jgi:hypothetical protein
MYLTQVGHGLSREPKALKLAFEHWIEAVSTISTNPLVFIHKIHFTSLAVLRFSNVLISGSKEAIFQYHLILIFYLVSTLIIRLI